jgi:hypothetical protein
MTCQYINMDPVGLCASCAHAFVVRSNRGSVFYRCGLSATDPRFEKYPRLPVLSCVGYDRRAAGPTLLAP